MSNYNSLKATIDANIKQNGNQEITGQILNSVLNQMVNILGAGYQFAGVATIDTNPGTPDAKVFYIANGKGTYEKFGGINVTEDDVVVLYWDASWHKVSTGIASQEKLSELRSLIGEKADEADLATVAKTGKYADLVGKPTTLSGYGITDAYTKTKTDELLNTKQNELTLTVKDNGNIVIGNIQGQTKEFMPATPSGDPMHYAYVAAGAEYNGTGEDIVKTAPWADMIDDDYTGEYGKTVVHKAGHWYLNGIGNITTNEIRKCYYNSHLDILPVEAYRFANNITNFNFIQFPINNTIKGNLFAAASTFVVFNTYCGKGNRKLINDFSLTFYKCEYLRHIYYAIEPDYSTKKFNDSFKSCKKLISLMLNKVNANISFSDSPNLSIKSVLYMINMEAATSPITITLHKTVYDRCMANTDISTALQAHTNVSLASA